jgi:hypothetical protein
MSYNGFTIKYTLLKARTIVSSCARLLFREQYADFDTNTRVAPM